MKISWEDLVNKGSNFADFVRFRPHTYTHTHARGNITPNEVQIKAKLCLIKTAQCIGTKNTVWRQCYLSLLHPK